MELKLITDRRTEHISSLLKKYNLDALVISRLVHIRYLTGFTGTNALYIITRRKQYFVTDSRYEHQARQQVQQSEVIITADSLLDAVHKKNILRRAKRVGFESNHVSYSQYRNFRKLFTKIRWISLAGSLEPVIQQKTPAEIKNIKKAIAISEQAFSETLHLIKPGVREREIATELSYRQRNIGADSDAFPFIIASGVRAALPHGTFTDKKIKNRELIIIDFGSVVNGYHSDITRTIAVGTISKEAKKCYIIVRDALRRAIDTASEYILGRELDAAARNFIKRRGYGKHFTHSLGHGIGLDVHEYPRISPLSDEMLQKNSVITIEPGIYIPRRFGIRIEDDVLITGNGCKKLTSLSDELIEL